MTFTDCNAVLRDAGGLLEGGGGEVKVRLTFAPSIRVKAACRDFLLMRDQKIVSASDDVVEMFRKADETGRWNNGPVELDLNTNIFNCHVFTSLFAGQLEKLEIVS